MSFEEENEVSQHLPASELKELTFLTKRSSSSKLGPELECAHSMGIPHMCTDGRCLPGAAPGGCIYYKVFVRELRCVSGINCRAYCIHTQAPN